MLLQAQKELLRYCDTGISVLGEWRDQSQPLLPTLLLWCAAAVRWAVFITIMFGLDVDGNNETSYNTVLFAVADVLLYWVSEFDDTLIFCLLQPEMSHRSSDFNKILDRTKNLLRELL